MSTLSEAYVRGIIPDKDIPLLEKLGVRKVFQPGARTDDIVSFLETALSERGSSIVS